MFFGILCGSLAAFLQSTSYVFSRIFVQRHGSAMMLSICSQLHLGIMGAGCLLLTLPWVKYPFTVSYCLLAAAWAVSFVLAQVSFFAALKSVEASRLASLLGLKLIALAILAMLFTGENLTFLRWSAVLLCSLSAVGMNFTGGRLKGSSCFWVIMCVLNFAICDLCCTQMIKSMPLC